MAQFECIDVCKNVSGRRILNRINMHISRGEVVALLGPNGAGKTTCFSILCGMIKPDSGYIKLNGRDISNLPMYKRARLGIGYLPQEPSTFRGLTVEENILAVLETRNCEDKDTAICELLSDFSISHVKNTKAVLLSGGERRKLEIARALANNPSYILLDEPLAGIDPLAIADMRNTVSNLKKQNIGVIITDHNVRDTLPMVDRAYIISGGEIIAHGTAKEIIKDEKVIANYLGHMDIGEL